MVNNDGVEVATVRIDENNDAFSAKVISFGPASGTKYCHNCTGIKKGKSLLSIDIFWDLISLGGHYGNGTILDPGTGKEYDLVVYPHGEQLEVRGYLGVPLFGKSQFWVRSGN